MARRSFSIRRTLNEDSSRRIYGAENENIRPVTADDLQHPDVAVSKKEEELTRTWKSSIGGISPSSSTTKSTVAAGTGVFGTGRPVCRLAGD